MMSLGLWVLSYAADTTFWMWVIFWGGADRLEDTFASGFLISTFAPNWTADGIRIFGWLTVAVSTVAFVAGIFMPAFRS